MLKFNRKLSTQHTLVGPCETAIEKCAPRENPCEPHKSQNFKGISQHLS